MLATVHTVKHFDHLKILMTHDYDIVLPQRNRLEYMQKIVGGLIDIYYHQGRDWIVNDEGLLLGLPLNPWALNQGLEIAGTIIEVHGVLE